MKKESNAKQERKEVKDKKWNLSEFMKGKKKKDNTAVLRKNTLLRAARAFFWGMLIFFFIKGIYYTFRPDTLTQAQELISEFNQDLEKNKKLNNEICSFAQNFAKEYLTYSKNEENEYQERLKRYISGVGGMDGITLRTGDAAKAVYVEAYRMEQYSEKQWDVYVLAEVEYWNDVEEKLYEQTCLKVPVYVSEKGMIVEAIPLFVNDTMLLQGYVGTEYTGTMVDEQTATAVTTAVSNFLKAYYEQDETVIDYYLTNDADRKMFSGLNGRYRFAKMDSFKCYKEPDQDFIICVTGFKITDSVNEVKIAQKLCIKVIKQSDGKYYIAAINPRITK